MKNKYKMGQKFKHKIYGFTGELVCINWWDNSHIISLYDGQKKQEYSFVLKKEFVEYPSIIK